MKRKTVADYADVGKELAGLATASLFKSPMHL